MIRVPTSVEPVKEIFDTRGSLTSAPPTEPPGPGSTLTASSGTPASTRIPASFNTVRGVYVAGLTTTVLPHASAGASFHVEISSGKFHGVMSAHTPTGSRSVTSRPACWLGIVSPYSLFAAPPKYLQSPATSAL